MSPVAVPVAVDTTSALPQIVLGTSSFGRQLRNRESWALLGRAVACGITTIDTAPVYGSAFVGGNMEEALRSETIIGTAPASIREKLYVMTKFGFQDRHQTTSQLNSLERGSEEFIRTSLRESQERLKGLRVSIFLQHWPSERVPLEETVGTLDRLVSEGAIGGYGLCNMTVGALLEVDQLCSRNDWRRPSCLQFEASLLSPGRTGDERPCPIGAAYFVTWHGLLTDRFYHHGVQKGTRLSQVPHYVTPSRMEVVERVAALARKLQRPIEHIAIRWVSEFRASTVIIGATKPWQVAAQASAIAWDPSPDERHAMSELVVQDAYKR